MPCYECLCAGSTLATLPICGQSPQLHALRVAYDLSLEVQSPVTLTCYRDHFTHIVALFFRGSLLPLEVA